MKQKQSRKLNNFYFFPVILYENESFTMYLVIALFILDFWCSESFCFFVRVTSSSVGCERRRFPFSSWESTQGLDCGSSCGSGGSKSVVDVDSRVDISPAVALEPATLLLLTVADCWLDVTCGCCMIGGVLNSVHCFKIKLCFNRRCFSRLLVFPPFPFTTLSQRLHFPPSVCRRKCDQTLEFLVRFPTPTILEVNNVYMQS